MSIKSEYNNTAINNDWINAALMSKLSDKYTQKAFNGPTVIATSTVLVYKRLSLVDDYELWFVNL
jgi:hypothetical protein